MPGGAVLAMPRPFVSSHGKAEASTAPMPMKKLCIAKPVVRCSSGSRSPTKARNGSIVTLIEASMIHRVTAANHNAGDWGMASSAAVVTSAPNRKYGRRRPSRVQVRSLK